MRSPITAISCLLIAVLLLCLAAYGQEEQKDETGALDIVHLKRSEPRSLAVIRHRGPFSEIPQLMTRLMTEVEKGGYYAAGPMMCAYFNSPDQVPEQELLWEVIVPVAKPGPFQAIENDKLGFTYMNALLVAYLFHIGSYQTLGETYSTLFDWAAKNNYEIAGPPTEVYWSDPQVTPEEGLVTEVWLPVKEKTSPGGAIR
jgi:AraC family transcriptional regulator